MLGDLGQEQRRMVVEVERTYFASSDEAESAEPSDSERPSGSVIASPLAVRVPFFDRYPLTTTVMPGDTLCRPIPRRASAFGELASIAQVTTWPAGSATSR